MIKILDSLQKNTNLKVTQERTLVQMIRAKDKYPFNAKKNLIHVASNK
jgi:hypothetical protein